MDWRPPCLIFDAWREQVKLEAVGIQWMKAIFVESELAQVALTEKWTEMYGNKGIGFYSMHPGWADTPGVAKSLPGFSKSLSGKLRSSEEGADTVLWLALQPKEKLESGTFYFDRAPAPKHLSFSGTSGSHAAIGKIMESLRSLCSLP